MSYQDIRVETTAHVTTIILARPKRRNAVDGIMAAELADAFSRFEASTARVAVLWGEGSSFCAGADLKAIGSARGNRTEPHGDAPMGLSRLQLSKPTIAAISGHAVAGGLELALWCDLRVAEHSAIFGVFCRRWGVPLIDGGTVRLPRLIGQSRALDMILTGRPVPAEEAERFGLANRVVLDGQALAVAQEMAAQMAHFPQACLRSDRASALAQWSLPEPAAMAQELALGMSSLETDGRGGARRFADGAGRHGTFE